jgi:hypothetical protein
MKRDARADHAATDNCNFSFHLHKPNQQKHVLSAFSNAELVTKLFKQCAA